MPNIRCTNKFEGLTKAKSSKKPSKLICTPNIL